MNIDKILGFGSMGIVYFGQLFDTKVVIKLIEHGTGVLGKEQVSDTDRNRKRGRGRQRFHTDAIKVLVWLKCFGARLRFSSLLSPTAQPH